MVYVCRQCSTSTFAFAKDCPLFLYITVFKKIIQGNLQEQKKYSNDKINSIVTKGIQTRTGIIHMTVLRDCQQVEGGWVYH